MLIFESRSVGDDDRLDIDFELIVLLQGHDILVRRLGFLLFLMGA